MILAKHARSFRNLIMKGGLNVGGESLIMLAAFSKAFAKQKRNASA